MITEVSCSRSDIRDGSSVHDDEPATLIYKDPDNPSWLLPAVTKHLDNLFLNANVTYISGQRKLLIAATAAILNCQPGTVTAIPFPPGLGKSTLIRALLSVFSKEFQKNSKTAERLGGVIVVVEKTAEAEQLAELCNYPIKTAHVVSSPNDYTLSQGRCPNGALKFEDCPGHSCPEYMQCPLIQASKALNETPILILLHARYQRYMENMEPLLHWFSPESNCTHPRTLLLVDELPPLIREQELSIPTLNGIENRLSSMAYIYSPFRRRQLALLHSQWDISLRRPFLKLLTSLSTSPQEFGLMSTCELQEAGLSPQKLKKLKEDILNYAGAESGKEIVDLLDTMSTCSHAYYGAGQEPSIFFPRICQLNTPLLSTFLFSGTANITPEVMLNPNIKVLDNDCHESFQRLTIHTVQTDAFRVSRTALQSGMNYAAMVAWLKELLPMLGERHHKILVVTYKPYAERLWWDLRTFHDMLIPYVAPDGSYQNKLPYFGGMNGSNVYQESTCAVCAGLNRFEMKDYIARTIALDLDNHITAQLQTILEATEGDYMLINDPSVLDTQNKLLASDLIQLVFRTALRHHGSKVPIDLWIVSPPSGVIDGPMSRFSTS